jgi:AraC-like DNA-binding protein
MAWRRGDGRTWSSTDRPGEKISVARPVSGVEILSVYRSNRHWRETHAGYTVAAVHRQQGELVADWRTRCRSLSTERGGLMGMEPGDVHVTQRLKSRQGAADFDVLTFSPALVTRAAEQLGVRGSFHFRTPASTDALAFGALDRLVTTVASGEDALSVECAITEALTVLVARLGEAPSEHGLSLDPERDYRLRRVKEYLAAHLDRRPTLLELEGVSGLCQFRLCALFKRSYSASIGQCWNALRLRRAVDSIQRGRSIQLVVAELGYLDESYLWRVFKSHYGVAPGAWREMFRANDRARRLRTRPRDPRPAR